MKKEYDQWFDEADQNKNNKLNEDEWFEFNKRFIAHNEKEFKQAVQFDICLMSRFYLALNKLDSSYEGISKVDLAKNGIIFNQLKGSL